MLDALAVCADVQTRGCGCVPSTSIQKDIGIQRKHFLRDMPQQQETCNVNRNTLLVVLHHAAGAILLAHSGWEYGPSGGLGLVVMILIILLLGRYRAASLCLATFMHCNFTGKGKEKYPNRSN
jgi:hypothetical protein